jgi:hypothetical protein
MCAFFRLIKASVKPSFITCCSFLMFLKILLVIPLLLFEKTYSFFVHISLIFELRIYRTGANDFNSLFQTKHVNQKPIQIL